MTDTTNDSNAPEGADDETSEMRFGAGETAWLAVVTVLALLGVALGVIALIVAKDNSGGSASGGSTAPPAELSALAQQGQEIADANGCLTCHSTDGADGTGPTWAGLAGAEVTLDDGTTVTADDAYLAQSITDPASQKVEGFNVAMPEFDLSQEEVDALVAYVGSLGGTGS